MTNFDAIDALLAEARKEVPLPPAEERRSLREGLNVSRPQFAQAQDVSPSTVAGWESGRDPSGEVREKYAYFLNGARDKLAAAVAEEAPAEEPADAHQESGDDDVVVTLAAVESCVLCGEPARHQVAVSRSTWIPRNAAPPSPHRSPSPVGRPPSAGRTAPCTRRQGRARRPSSEGRRRPGPDRLGRRRRAGRARGRRGGGDPGPAVYTANPGKAQLL
ncbi:hypothetical protein [Streptomyces sp. P17]|uniref:helix-turn-helix domain-containing protein n=1 Tax=Streptomyces sp. P17 TaxID=3074716 RepID=UPI0028F42A13|nr:hypothetical protein [Streptomyces sp. P17]MDT9695280.1 hypothetical protein [Streptomyces sp. P17]